MLEPIINDLSGFALITFQFMKADRLGDDVKIFIRGFIEVFGFWNTICI